MFESPPLTKLEEAIATPCSPIGMRMRAAYFLRQAYDNAIRNKDSSVDEGINTEETVDQIVIETLAKGLTEKEHGSLLRHEFAYVMGQLRDERVRTHNCHTSMLLKLFLAINRFLYMLNVVLPKPGRSSF
jgi:hypothetical protein